MDIERLLLERKDFGFISEAEEHILKENDSLDSKMIIKVEESVVTQRCKDLLDKLANLDFTVPVDSKLSISLFKTIKKLLIELSNLEKVKLYFNLCRQFEQCKEESNSFEGYLKMYQIFLQVCKFFQKSDLELQFNADLMKARKNVEFTLIERFVSFVESSEWPKGALKAEEGLIECLAQFAYLQEKGNEFPPIEILAEKIFKKFRYHFDSKVPTNRLDKPEWYLTFLSDCLRDNEEFLIHVCQPVVQQFTEIDLHLEFAEKLMNMAIFKFEKHYAAVVGNPNLLSHLVREFLLFQKTLNMKVLERLGISREWISVEYDLTVARVQSILEDKEAWESVDGVSKVTLRFCEYLESFIDLFLDISDVKISTKMYKIIFIQMLYSFHAEIEIAVEDLGNPCLVLNSINFILEKLNSWSFEVCFLEIAEYLKIDDLFAKISTEYIQTQQSLLKDITHSVNQSIKRELINLKYKESTHSPSSEAIQLIHTLQSTLYDLKLKKESFSTVWKKVAEFLDEYFLQEIILKALSLNEIETFSADYECICQIFSPYTTKPEKYIKCTDEALSLLQKKKTQKECTTLNSEEVSKLLKLSEIYD